MSMDQLFLVLGMLTIATAGALCALCEIVSRIQRRVSLLEESDVEAQWRRLKGFRFEPSPAELAASGTEARSDATAKRGAAEGDGPTAESGDAHD